MRNHLALRLAAWKKRRDMAQVTEHLRWLQENLEFVQLQIPHYEAARRRLQAQLWAMEPPLTPEWRAPDTDLGQAISASWHGYVARGIGWTRGLPTRVVIQIWEFICEGWVPEGPWRRFLMRRSAPASSKVKFP